MGRIITVDEKYRIILDEASTNSALHIGTRSIYLLENDFIKNLRFMCGEGEWFFGNKKHNNLPFILPTINSPVYFLFASLHDLNSDPQKRIILPLDAIEQFKIKRKDKMQKEYIPTSSLVLMPSGYIEERGTQNPSEDNELSLVHDLKNVLRLVKI
jgi:DNA-binding transcriptional regulator/RsmH inhibitor MraZ